MDDFRGELRQLPVLRGSAPPFDVSTVPDDPVTLFRQWLRLAVAHGVLEPQAMVISTVDADGSPDARALIVKDVDDAGWHFAANDVSAKGRQLAASPRAALTFYWPEQVRQIRVRGEVVRDPEDVRTADFLARPTGSRTMVLTGRQSSPLADARELDEEIAKAARLIEEQPDHVPDGWVCYAVRPSVVEFWQGDPERRHVRLRYRRDSVDAPWTTDRLWP